MPSVDQCDGAQPERHRTDIDSPCIDVCVLDSPSGLCHGCYRSMAEISRWATYSPREKLAVLEMLAQRKSIAARAKKT